MSAELTSKFLLLARLANARNMIASEGSSSTAVNENLTLSIRETYSTVNYFSILVTHSKLSQTVRQLHSLEIPISMQRK